MNPYQRNFQVKDKQFELELSWVGEMTKGLHQLVPRDVYEAADNFGKEALKEAENDSDDDWSRDWLIDWLNF